jgi:hypothetical protein
MVSQAPENRFMFKIAVADQVTNKAKRTLWIKHQEFILLHGYAKEIFALLNTMRQIVRSNKNLEEYASERIRFLETYISELKIKDTIQEPEKIADAGMKATYISSPALHQNMPRQETDIAPSLGKRLPQPTLEPTPAQRQSQDPRGKHSHAPQSQQSSSPQSHNENENSVSRQPLTQHQPYSTPAPRQATPHPAIPMPAPQGTQSSSYNMQAAKKLINEQAEVFSNRVERHTSASEGT